MHRYSSSEMRRQQLQQLQRCASEIDKANIDKIDEVK